MAGIDAVYEKVVNPLKQLSETLERAKRFKKGDADIKSANDLVISAISKIEATASLAPPAENRRPGPGL